jgi:hypothetical protein
VSAKSSSAISANRRGSPACRTRSNSSAMNLLIRYWPALGR